MRPPRLLIPAVVFVLALVLAAFTFLRDDKAPMIDTSKAQSNTSATADTSNTAGSQPLDDRPSRARMDPIRAADESMAIGDPDAPLVMVVFESFGCLWCGNFHRLTMPGIHDKYVDTGLLRVEARMFPYEERAMPGALVGAAAGMQDRYWQLAEVLYPFISGDGEPPTDRELSAAELGDYRQRQSEAALLAQVESHAAAIDLDYERFLTDYHSAEARARVQADTDLAYAIGFTGTPSIVVNGVPLGGYASFESFDGFLTSVLDASAPG